MGRKNRRKSFTVGKVAAFSPDSVENMIVKPECLGCAFVRFDGACMTSDGECLKTVRSAVDMVKTAKTASKTTTIVAAVPMRPSAYAKSYR